MMKKPSRKMITTLYLIIFLYIIIGLLLFRFQKKFTFRPTKLPDSYQYEFSGAFKEFNLPLNDTDRLNMVWLKTERPKGVVIYFHGNTGNIVSASRSAVHFLRSHFDVLELDYPGYGKSTGPNSELDLYHDALEAYKLARSYYPGDSIVLYGKSLGTAMASYVASKEPCRALVLECPFYSYDRLVSRYVPIYPVRWMLQYHFPVYQYIQHTRAPVLIFHGKKDEVIPFRQSRKLKAFLKPGDRYIAFPEGQHNDLTAQPGYQEALDSLLAR